MDILFPILIPLGPTLFLILLAMTVGGYNERTHVNSLEQRESETADMVVSQLKSFPGFISSDKPPKMFISETIISAHYVKMILVSIRNLFGGEVKSFRVIMERARRESVLRVLEQARQEGYNAVCNIRLDSVDINGAATRKQSKMALGSIMASGTAYIAQPKSNPDLDS